MSSLAEFEDVVKVYGPVQALGPLSLELPRGAVGLLGPNGSGKTTFLRILMGVLAPTAGTVRVLGHELTGNPRDIQRRIGYAPEGDTLFPNLTGVEAVAYAGRLVGMRKADAIERAHQVIDYVDLGEARYRLVEKYSTGMRQRLKLAQALVHDPELLILDEPTEGVDPQARAHILELISRLVREHDISLIIATHQLHDVEHLADYALVLRAGQSVAQGLIKDLKTAPKTSYTVRVNGPVEQLADHLAKAGVAFHLEPPTLRVESKDPHEILGWVQEAGLTVRHLVPTELSLTEAFQEAIGGA